MTERKRYSFKISGTFECENRDQGMDHLYNIIVRHVDGSEITNLIVEEGEVTEERKLNYGRSRSN
jgi:hypothetical protein